MPIKKLPSLLNNDQIVDLLNKYTLDDDTKSYLIDINNYLYCIKEKERENNAKKYKNKHPNPTNPSPK